MLGYGSQGRSLALNLRDSGYEVIIGLRPRSAGRKLARRDGFTNIATVAEASARGDIVCFAFPDYLHGRVHDAQIKSNLKSNATLWFLHGLSVHFGFVRPPKSSDVVLIAPHAPGLAVRQKFLGNESVSAFYAIHQNRSRQARSTVFALAEACGFKAKRLIKTTFRDEAIGDIFGEQAVLCGGLASLVHAGFETLVKKRIKPEHAYLEVAYQLDLIIALIKQFGISGMFDRISVAARYGSATTGPVLIDGSVRRRMEKIYQEVASGAFANRLNKLTPRDLRALATVTKKLTSPAFERAVRKFSR